MAAPLSALLFLKVASVIEITERPVIEIAPTASLPLSNMLLLIVITASSLTVRQTLVASTEDVVYETSNMN